MPAPLEIQRLVQRFVRNRDDYHSGPYHETQLRREFLDPMFKALGWDIDNEQGFAEAYKDVVHEDAIKIGGATKAPDYCFRVGGTRKFFLEAKRPAVNIKEDVASAYQLRRYAWSANLLLSILTDFEEFAVYDCRVQPHRKDKASAARILYLKGDELLTRWDELASVFSREAVLQGSFDRFAASIKHKRGTAEVDSAFLADIERWREWLARNLALRNAQLSQRELNFAVQRIIDRIIFLRIAEDRGIEDYGRLQTLLTGDRVYRRLGEMFRAADDRYNSGIFHFELEKGRREPPDELTLSLEVDDDTLQDILRALYYPESPYEFAVLPADILGQVYEQFLGKVIRLTAGHQARVEDKPEVKRAGGVFYTPSYIVEYIVRRTIGPLVDGKSPKHVSKLRVLDPACGSGSFLIGAYQFLLDWHTRWYTEHDPRKHSRQVFQGRDGAWRLTTAERKRILINNIFGVDIDSQAVEVTKLSLLLKVLEGENRETLERQRKLFHQRALPDLGDNIKCGNSLIGPDFYDQHALDSLSPDERLRINAFDWDAEFPAIMGCGGFDVVIGNPPYIRMESFKPLKAYLRDKYATHDERSDLYVYFIEREHLLLRPSGRFGMIVSNKFLRANYGLPVRRFLREHATLETIVDFAGLPVFPRATVRTIVLLTRRNGKQRKHVRYCPPCERETFERIVRGQLRIDDWEAEHGFGVATASLAEDVWSFVPPRVQRLLEKLFVAGQRLTDYCSGPIGRGIVSGLSEAFVIDESTRNQIVRRNAHAAEIIRPYLTGRDIRRYRISPAERQFLIYTPHGIVMDEYPAVLEHLAPFRQKLLKRATEQEWYELQQPQFRFVPLLERPKIVFPDISPEPRFALDDGGHYPANTVYFIPRDDRYLLGLLNSKVARFFFSRTCAGLEGSGEIYLRFFGQSLEQFPVPDPAADSSRSATLVKKVDQIRELQRHALEVRTDQERIAVERQIDAVNAQVDRLVFQLYGLNAEEMRLVEE